MAVQFVKPIVSCAAPACVLCKLCLYLFDVNLLTRGRASVFVLFHPSLLRTNTWSVYDKGVVDTNVCSVCVCVCVCVCT